jgi:hypothetical protein
MTNPPKKLQIFDDLYLKTEHTNEMKKSTVLIPGLIMSGHLVLIAAPANGGKTTIFLRLCEQLSAAGNAVIYVNADASPGDLIEQLQHATLHNYKVIAPDAIRGKGVIDVIDRFEAMAKGDTSLEGYVFVIDTLKKFVDMLDKKQLKNMLATFRNLTVKGATVCLLAHTNKYNGKDGKPIYEGMGDARTDVDELIYLDSAINPETGNLEITTRPDKKRADFTPRSFIIELPSRLVTELESSITIYSELDRNLLEEFIEAIKDGCRNQNEIARRVHARVGCGYNAVRDALNRLTKLSDAKIIKARDSSGKGYTYSLR